MPNRKNDESEKKLVTSRDRNEARVYVVYVPRLRRELGPRLGGDVRTVSSPR